MRIYPVKFQPSRSKGVGGDRVDRRTLDVTPYPMSHTDFSTSSFASLGRDKSGLFANSEYSQQLNLWLYRDPEIFLTMQLPGNHTVYIISLVAHCFLFTYML